MTDDQGKGAPALPPHPNLEHLKNDAKDRLTAMRAAAPDAKLADAQFAIARAYGFASWRALKDAIEKRGAPIDVDAFDTNAPLSACVGFYRHDPKVVENAVATVTCEGDALFLQSSMRPKLALTRQEDGWFMALTGAVRYAFGDVRDGAAQVLHAQGAGTHMRLRRIDAEAAERENAARASAAIEQAKPRTAIAVAPQILARYAGHYLSSQGVAIQIMPEDGRLFMQLTGQPRLELFAESENQFFMPLSRMLIAFPPGAQPPQALTMAVSGTITHFRAATAAEAAAGTVAMAQKSEAQKRPRTAIAVDAAALPHFTGRYQLTDNRVLTITADGGHLFGQMTGGSRHELFAESPSDFFFTAMPSQVSFVLDEAGRARHAIFHVAGHDIAMPRMAESVE